MNDPIIACVVALRSVIGHLESGKLRLRDLDSDELVGLLKPYGETIGDYLAKLAEDQRKVFRDKRGVQGQTWRRRQYEKAIRTKYPTFNPDGLDQYIEGEKAQTTHRGKQAIDHIEMMLQTVILEELKRECGLEESEWWMPEFPRIRD